MAGLTLAQAEAQLALWLAADAAVSANQSYSIGDRSLSRVDAEEIRKNVSYWDAKVKELTASGTGRRRTRYAVLG